MRAFLFILFLSFFLVSKAQYEKASKKDTDLIESIKDTILLNNQGFIRTLKKNHFYCLLSMKGDTIIKPQNYYFEAKFLDIDEDGYKDIRVFIFSNTPNECENYLFDTAYNTFRLIENCDLDIKKIKGTDFYYSYNRAGCADMNWESYLSKIENFKLVLLGYIYGKGCDYKIEENPQEIKIYKIANSGQGNKTLVRKLLYKKYISEFEEKWGFIENYWSKNYNKFSD